MPKGPKPRDFKQYPIIDFATIATQPIHSAFASLPLAGSILVEKNRYKRNTVALIDEELKKSKRVVNTRDFEKYTAGSIIGHWLDSASYLGRALQAQQRGDYQAAAHLAYYSQLRGAMSILATRGITVLNTRHTKLDLISGNFDSVYSATCGTHQFVWFALSDLTASKAPPLAPIIAKSLSTSEFSLASLLSELLPGKASLPSWEIMLKAWGIDIARNAQDRALRNESSYRPEFTREVEASPLQTATFLLKTWPELQPVVGSPFSSLDRYLIRKSIEEEWVGVKGPLLTTRYAYRLALDRALTNLSVAPAMKDQWLKFFLRENGFKSESAILNYASLSTSVSVRFSHLGVIARAILLFRMTSVFAMDASANLLTYNAPCLHFQNYVNNSGISSIPVNVVDLWDDIQLDLDDLEANIAATRSGLFIANARQLSELALFEVVPLWTIAA